MTMNPTHHDLQQATREKVVANLNQHLADLMDLYTQDKQAHWNVKGPNFYQLHELFDELAGKVLGFIDEIAERATALGGVAKGTARMAAANSKLSEFPDGPVMGMKSVKMLVERYATVAKSVRKAIDECDDLGDKATADLYTDVARELDKDLWFLEAHLQDEK